jgi:mannose-6-phosphate isomerase-like protein (cupin superfamily)
MVTNVTSIVPRSDGADVNSWQRTASRAAHPSTVGALLEPGDLLLEIAAGLGRVAVPTELMDAPVAGFGRELVLTTPAYDVWIMHWPVGTVADLHSHDRHVAFHIVSGQLVEERVTSDGTRSLLRTAGSTTVVPPHTPHRLSSTATTTTVHVHAKDPR